MICEKNKCTGCGACKNICPKNCVELKYNEEGFLFPVIDKEVCIRCGLCKKVCPSNYELENNNNSKPLTYGGYYYNEETLLKSSSGGIFAALADYILKEGGVICGASVNDDLIVEHIIATNKDEYQKMHGSKYIQSDTKNTFSDIKKYLLNNQKVLFVGTGCQVAGLYNYLGEMKNNNNLFTVDLICHGVGSVNIFNKYINYLEKKYNDKVTNVSFRSKKNGWRTFTTKISFRERKPIYIKAVNDLYMICYVNEAIYRESCYNCPYASLPRIADITLGDFVGIDKKLFDVKQYEKGISVILVNNKQGETIINKIKDNLVLHERNLDEAVKTNKNIAKPSSRPFSRNFILQENNDIIKLQRKYCKVKFKQHIANILGYKNVEKIKSIIKK